MMAGARRAEAASTPAAKELESMTERSVTVYSSPT
jgi:hypothetical protein